MAPTSDLPIRTKVPPNDASDHHESQGTRETDLDTKPKKKNKKKKKGKNRAVDPSETFKKHYGANFDNVAPWVRLCRDLGVEIELTSKTQCKKILEKTFINILDFLDAVDRREEDVGKHSDPSARAAALEAPVQVRRFESERALSAYTLKHRRVYPGGEVRQDRDHPLKLLMKQILYPRGGRKAKAKMTGGGQA